MPFLHLSPIRCLSCTALKLVLRHGFPLDMLSAVLRFERSYPALPLARQLEHQGFTIPGPLVQRNNSLSFQHFFNVSHPKKIGSVLFLNALNPTRVPLSSANSRTLGSFFTPRMGRVDIEVPNDPVDKNSRGSSACSHCYHRGSLSPISLCFHKGQTMSSTFKLDRFP